MKTFRLKRGLFAPFIVCCLIALFTAGCSTGGEVKEGAAPQAGSGDSSTPAQQEEVRTIQHSMGTAEMKGTPKNIVVLEWTYAEDLIALGIQPKGVADVEGYKKYVNAQPGLSADVIDVGTRQEPSLELITSLKPDLIIAENFRVKDTYEQLKAIAPTVVFDNYSKEASQDQYATMENSFRTIADIVGKKEEGEKVLADVQATFDNAKAKLKAAGKEHVKFALIQGFSNQDAAVMLLYSDNSIAAGALKRAGFENAYQPNPLPEDGYAQTTVESLVPVQDANLLYVVQDDDNIIEKQMKNNAVWNGLHFVKEQKTYPLGGDMWVYGGPLSAKILVDKAVSLLTQ
uniref:ABC transporter substrate-binding protein n=1 Tax=Paenibacillus terrae TaxID=159743 RepID=UPI0011A94200|nr:iron-siderophore ABC transporter substrate-binding protein [Paenibacillus terrae]